MNREKGFTEAMKNSPFRHRGQLKVDKDNYDKFRYEDGSYPILCGYECDFLWSLAQSREGIEKVRKFIKKLRAVGFEMIYMNSFAYDCDWELGRTSPDDYGPPTYDPWVMQNESYNYKEFNETFFYWYDQLMNLLLEEGMMAHIYLKVYNKNVAWPEKNSEEEELYFKYWVERYREYPNIIWDFAKEAYYEEDIDYIARTLKKIKTWDKNNHLLTVHDCDAFYEKYASDGIVDFVTIQRHEDFYSSVLLEKERYKMPIVFAEFGYEYGPKGEGDVTYGVGQSPEVLLERAYTTVMAGAYIVYYYTYTAWDVIRVDDYPKGYEYFEKLIEFCEKYKIYTMNPETGLTVYRNFNLKNAENSIIYHESKVPLIIRSEKKIKACWYNIYTGEISKADSKTYEVKYVNQSYPYFECPFKEKNAILIIKNM